MCFHQSKSFYFAPQIYLRLRLEGRKRVADGDRDLREQQGVSKVLAVGRRKMISKPKDQEPVERA